MNGSKNLLTLMLEMFALPDKSMKLKNMRLAIQRLVLICPTTNGKKMLEEGLKNADNDDEEPIEIVGKKRSNAIRDESEPCIEESSIDETEAADLAADDATENDTAAAPPDVCLTLEAAVPSELPTGAEGSGITTSALPVYREQNSVC